MYVLTVIPISRGVGKEELTYFSPENVPLGSVVRVPLRSRIVPALVVTCADAAAHKTELRQAPFALKKIKAVGNGVLSEHVIRAAERLADYHAATRGAVLAALVPKVAFDIPCGVANTNNTTPRQTMPERLIFQTSDSERLSRYRSLVREMFAKDSSIAIAAPTITHAAHIFENLKHGVEHHAFLLHSGLPAAVQKTAWRGVHEATHPVLVVCTVPFLTFHRTDLKMIVLEHEHAASYKMTTRPFLDLRRAAEEIAYAASVPIIFGDSFLRVETFFRYKAGELSALVPPKSRYLTHGTEKMLDMRRTDAERPFTLFHADVEKILTELPGSGIRLFLFGARRGIAGVTVCRDCGTTVLCKLCGAPIVLHKENGGTVFVCHKCGARQSSKETCVLCGGWRLESLGIGVERIAAALKDAYPRVRIFLIDSDSVKNNKAAEKVYEAWHATPGSVLIGTEMALPYVTETDWSIIVSLDSLFAVPDFRMNEKIFGIISRLREVSAQGVYVATRSPEQEVLTMALHGAVADMYRRESEEREVLGYPPYRVFIKITRSGERANVEKDIRALAADLSEYGALAYSASSPVRRAYTMHVLLSLAPSAWPNGALRQKLLALPLSYIIDVNPESVL